MIKRLTKRFSKSTGHFWQEVNSNVAKAQYAVRGQVPTQALQIQNQILTGKNKYPFDKITFCNIGNPQAFGQPPISYHRQVLSVLVNPELGNTSAVSQDVKKRAKKYLQEIVSVGSYTQSIGIPIVRNGIAQYIQRSDGLQQKPESTNVFTTQGASQGVHLILSSIITKPTDAIMIPIPQYPLYSACISLYNGSAAPYYLNEQCGWQISVQQIEKSYRQSKQRGQNPKVIVIINPGNPTGAVFSKQTILNIIQFSVKNKLLIIADQVYRNNVYKDNILFHSVRSILNKSSLKNQAEVVSVNSTSKGLLGQCGMRAGYLELYNINPQIKKELIKMKSIQLCSNAIGQCLVDLMVNPPNRKTDSQETVNQYQMQIGSLFKSLKNRAQIVQRALQSMNNINVQQITGAMYAFPSIKFSQKRLKEAKQKNKSADLLYCLQCLQKTGIALVPGSGFLQKAQTYHFRITTLILPDSKLDEKMQKLRQFNNEYHSK